MAMLLVHRKAYTRTDGTRVKATTYKTADKGARGRTPKTDQWYNPKVHTGWRASMPADARRAVAIRAHKGMILATARSLMALANVQSNINPEVSRKARADADYFFRLYNKRKTGSN
jgi:hypothetical protein